MTPLHQEDVRIENWRLDGTDGRSLRIVHIPTGVAITREVVGHESVIAVRDAMLEQLSREVAEATKIGDSEGGADE